MESFSIVKFLGFQIFKIWIWGASFVPNLEKVTNKSDGKSGDIKKCLTSGRSDVIYGFPLLTTVLVKGEFEI